VAVRFIPEYQQKPTDLSQVTYKLLKTTDLSQVTDKLYHIMCDQCLSPLKL